MSVPETGNLDHWRYGRPLLNRQIETGSFDFFRFGRPHPVAGATAVVFADDLDNWRFGRPLIIRPLVTGDMNNWRYGRPFPVLTRVATVPTSGEVWSTCIGQMGAFSYVQSEMTGFHGAQGPPPPSESPLQDLAIRRRRRPHWES